MKTLQRFLMGLATVAVPALSLQLAAPKAVHGLVVALIRDVDNPGRATIVVPSCTAFSAPDNTEDFGCNTSYTVPAGQRPIVEQGEANCFTPAGNSLLGAAVGIIQEGAEYYHPLVLTYEGVDLPTTNSISRSDTTRIRAGRSIFPLSLLTKLEERSATWR